MISRRDLLKWLGIGVASVYTQKTIAKETQSTFDFKSFEGWLKATTKSIRENKLSSFRITPQKDFLRINGVADSFINSYTEYKKYFDNYYKEHEYLPIEDKNAPRASSSISVSIDFIIEANKVPVRFFEAIKTKNGRILFVEMAIKNELNNVKDVGRYLLKCDEKSKKYQKERFLNYNERRGCYSDGCTCYGSDISENCPVHADCHKWSKEVGKELRKRGSMTHKELVEFSKGKELSEKANKAWNKARKKEIRWI